MATSSVAVGVISAFTEWDSWIYVCLFIGCMFLIAALSMEFVFAKTPTVDLVSQSLSQMQWRQEQMSTMQMMIRAPEDAELQGFLRGFVDDHDTMREALESRKVRGLTPILSEPLEFEKVQRLQRREFQARLNATVSELSNLQKRLLGGD